MKTAPTTIAVHGFGFDPDSDKHSPFRRFIPELRTALETEDLNCFAWFSVPMGGRGYLRTWWRWPPMLHRYRLAWSLSDAAATDLALEIARRAGRGERMSLVGHSLGTRVILLALAQLDVQLLPTVHRVLLLNGAALQRDALTVMAFRGEPFPPVLNVAVRSDDVLKRLGERFVPGRGHCIGCRGLNGVGQVWRDAFLDDADLRARARGRRGWELAGDNPKSIGDHFFSYRNAGNWPLYRAWLAGDDLADLLPWPPAVARPP